MDAFAVSIVSSSIYKELHIRHALRMAFFFGAFQAIMPLVGYAAGQTVAGRIGMWDHWIAFGILSAIGGKMVYEAFKMKQVEKRPKDPSNLAVLLVLSIATSIDALAVGLSMSMLRVSIWMPAAVIGIVALVFTVVGMHIGRLVSTAPRFSNYAEACGGIVLFFIGIKILHDHNALFF